MHKTGSTVSPTNWLLPWLSNCNEWTYKSAVTLWPTCCYGSCSVNRFNMVWVYHNALLPSPQLIALTWFIVIASLQLTCTSFLLRQWFFLPTCCCFNQIISSYGHHWLQTVLVDDRIRLYIALSTTPSLVQWQSRRLTCRRTQVLVPPASTIVRSWCRPCFVLPSDVK